MIHRWILAPAVLGLLLPACGPDPNDAPGAVASSIEQAAAAASSGSCGPVQGYTAPINDKGVATAEGGAMTISANDFFFQPTCVRAGGVDTVTLKVTNTGSILHNVTIADQSIDVDVAPGASVEVHVKVAAAPVVYVCKFHRTAGMVGAVLPSGS